MDKAKDPAQVLIDLRNKFREAAIAGILTGDQKSIFELTLISILNEAEEQRQRCLQLKHQYEREAARADAQATSFQTTQNLVYTVFGSIIRKLQQQEVVENPKEDIVEHDKKDDLSEEEIAAVAAIAAKQAEKEKQTTKARKKALRK